MMQIRTTSVPGDPTGPNEDFVVAAGGLVAVLDGVSIPDGLDSGCIHGTAWYVHQLGKELVTQHDNDPSADLRGSLRDAITAVRQLHGAACDPDHPGAPQATLALLRARNDACDYLVLGDCSIVLDTGTTPSVVTDRRMLDFARDHRAHALSNSVVVGSADHADRIRALTTAKRRHVNQPDGYWIAAGNPTAAHHAIGGRVPLRGPDGLRQAALLTDGSSCVVDPYQLTTWTGLLNLLHADGPDAVVSLARCSEQGDPDGDRHPRPKTHDDATIAYCQFTTERS